MFVLPLPHWSLVSIVAFTLAGCLAAAPVSWQPPFNLTAVTDANTSIILTVVENSLIISEFLAENTPGKLTDEDLEAVDWIELHNQSTVDVNLAGWTLTDDPLTPNKWVFPALTLPAGGYRIVFASGKNRTPLTGNVHTNFRLDALGEYLGLFSPAGAIASEFGSAAAGYPPQAAGVSYGVFGPQRQTGYMLTPTPQAANNAASGVAGLVADTKFSSRRGFHPAPFDLTITTATWSALNSAYFTVNAVPANATNLVVSEIHYHPAENWVASRSLHGAPGEDDPFGLAGDPAADRDGDGVSALLEYALGTLDSTPGDASSRFHADLVEAPNAADTTRYLTLQFTRNLMAHNAVNLLPEISNDLVSWQSRPAVEFVSEENHGDGTSTVTWRSTAPVSATLLQAMRIKAVIPP